MLLSRDTKDSLVAGIKVIELYCSHDHVTSPQHHEVTFLCLLPYYETFLAFLLSQCRTIAGYISSVIM